MTIDLYVVKLVAVLVPTVILAAIDWWLRTARRVTDPTLWWLWAALLTWSIAAAVGSIWKPYAVPAAYILSPVNNAFFVGAVFHLNRVRELLGKPLATRLFLLAEAVVVFIGIVSIVCWSIGQPEVAKPIDAVMSVLTFAMLTAGLGLSFHHYAQPLMGGIAMAACLASAARQVLAAAPTSQLMDTPWFVLSGVATNMTLAMTLVALTAAWNFSTSTEFVIVGEPVTVHALVLFVDMRGSTAWTYKLNNLDRVRRFMNALRKWIMQAAGSTIGTEHRPELIKFLGDGFLLIWEMPDNIDTERHGAAMALTLQDGYAAFKRELMDKDRMPDDFPMDIGVGLAVGPALRLTAENGLRDYLGTAVNLAAKFQGKTRANGGVVVADSTVAALLPETQARFAFEESMNIANVLSIKVRGTRSFT